MTFFYSEMIRRARSDKSFISGILRACHVRKGCKWNIAFTSLWFIFNYATFQVSLALSSGLRSALEIMLPYIASFRLWTGLILPITPGDQCMLLDLLLPILALISLTRVIFFLNMQLKLMVLYMTFAYRMQVNSTIWTIYSWMCTVYEAL